MHVRAVGRGPGGALLEVPDDYLRLAVMRCISKVPLGQIENDEMNLLVNRTPGTRQTPGLAHSMEAFRERSEHPLHSVTPVLCESWLAVVRGR